MPPPYIVVRSRAPAPAPGRLARTRRERGGVLPVAPEEGAVRERDLDPGTVEADLDALAELAGDLPLPEREHLRDDAEVDRRIGQRLEPRHLGRIDERRSPQLVLVHRLPDRLQHRDHVVRVLPVRDAHVQHDPRPGPRQVAHPVDLAVRDHVHDALDVAEHDHPQRHPFDRAGGGVDADDVADPELVLEEDEEPADDVLDQRLRTERDREADDPRAGEERRDVHSHRAENHEHGQHHQDHDPDAAQQAEECAGALRLRRHDARRGRLLDRRLDPPEQELEAEEGEPSHHEHRRHAQRGGGQDR
jgi:hypothetical protein